MALEKCNDAITSAIGRELDDKEKRIVQARAIELKNKIDRSNNPDTAEDVLKQFSDEVKFNRVLQRRNTALNYAAFAKVEAWRKSVDYVKKDPAAGFRAFMRGDLRNFEGSKKSLANRIDDESNGRTGAMLADLAKSNLTQYAFSGADDLNITKAWSDIKNGVEPDPAYGKNAIAVAQILDKHLEVLRQDQNKAGAWIGRASDRLFRRSHDAYKIAKAGGNGFGLDQSRDYWTKFVGDRMDWDKSFGGEYAGVSDGARETLLRGLWKDFKDNNHYKPGEATPPIGMGTRNIAKKLSHGRQIMFRSPEDELTYFKTFGTGTSVAENVFHNLSGGGRDVALMKRLGPNPEATINKIISSWRDDMEQDDSVSEDTKEDFRETTEKEMSNTWNLMTKGSGHPADNFIGKFADVVRSTTNTAALGMSVNSLPGDLALRARMVHQMSGEPYSKVLAEASAAMAAPSNISAVERQQYFAELGIRTEGVHLPLDPNSSDFVGFGGISKFNQKVMSVTGHAWWDNKFRLNSLVADAYRHWAQRAKSFDQLHPSQQNSFLQYGINKDGWDIIRSSEATQFEPGKSGFMPSALEKMPLDNFKSLVNSKDPSDTQLRNARDDLKDNYQNYMGELAERSTSAPSTANNAIMQLGREDLKRGSLGGELYRGALQLKGWAVNYMRNHLGAELYGYDNMPKSWGQAMADMMKLKNPKGLAGLAKLISSGVIIGAATNAIRDVESGKTPESPFTFNGIGRAFARQSLGIYSDFLLQDARPDASFWDRVGQLTGPEYGVVSDAFDNVNKLGHQLGSAEGITPEKLGVDERQWFQDVYRRVPGTNLFWTKAAMDYMILNNISEALNPGYQQRLMDTAAKKDQHYLLGAPGPQTQP